LATSYAVFEIPDLVEVRVKDEGIHVFCCLSLVHFYDQCLGSERGEGGVTITVLVNVRALIRGSFQQLLGSPVRDQNHKGLAKPSRNPHLQPFGCMVRLHKRWTSETTLSTMSKKYIASE
jgi:hypothetical protein